MTDTGYTPRAAATEPDRGDLTFLPAVLKRTVWGAVFAGAVAAVGIQMVMTVLGVAIGATTVDTGSSTRGVGAVAGLWWLATGTISLLIGGAVVGRMAGIPKSIDVMLHAFAMWAVTAVFGFLLLWGAAGMVSYAGSNMARSMTMGISWTETQVLADGAPGGLTADGTRVRPVDGVADVTPAEAEEARRVTQTASWWTLIGLLMGIAASVLGGWFTAPNRFMVRPASQG